MVIIQSGVIVGLVSGWMVHVTAVRTAATSGSTPPPGTFCQKVVTAVATSAAGAIFLGLAIFGAACTLMRQ
jgi:hypothetical protein